MKIGPLLIITLLLPACASKPPDFKSQSKATQAAIAAHRECGSRNLDALLASKSPGSPRDLALSAEGACASEREAIRSAVEAENAELAQGDYQREMLAGGYADAVMRRQQDLLVHDLVVVQELRRR